jgi:hypothetical protein
MYRTFHQNDPKRITKSSSLRVPKQARLVGDALEVLYRSDKRDPSTGKQPRKPIDYIHEHDEGVKVYLPDGRADTDVPDFIHTTTELVLLGDCLGFTYYDEEGDQEIEAQVSRPLPELYTIPSGRALLVIQNKRTILAIIWGGRLGVEARGIVH